MGYRAIRKRDRIVSSFNENLDRSDNEYSLDPREERVSRYLRTRQSENTKSKDARTWPEPEGNDTREGKSNINWVWRNLIVTMLKDGLLVERTV